MTPTETQCGLWFALLLGPLFVFGLLAVAAGLTALVHHRSTRREVGAPPSASERLASVMATMDRLRGSPGPTSQDWGSAEPLIVDAGFSFPMHAATRLRTLFSDSELISMRDATYSDLTTIMRTRLGQTASATKGRLDMGYNDIWNQNLGGVGSQDYCGYWRKRGVWDDQLRSSNTALQQQLSNMQDQLNVMRARLAKAEKQVPPEFDGTYADFVTSKQNEARALRVAADRLLASSKYLTGGVESAIKRAWQAVLEATDSVNTTSKTKA